MGDREQAKAPEGSEDRARDNAPAPMAGLPGELIATIQQAPPEAIAAILREHPELAAPLLAAVHQLRGNAVAQTAVAAVASAPLRKDEPKSDAKPTPESTQYKSPAAPKVEPEKPVDAAHAKNIERGKVAAWEQVASAGVSNEGQYPAHVRLPPNIVQALDKTWQDTLATKTAYEQGGNLVRHYGGSYGVRRKTNDNAGLFDQDDKDVGRLDTLVAQVHTHPYREEKQKVPEEFASFSDGDFDSLMRSDASMSLLRSGPYTFLLSKTKQFNKLVAETNNDEGKMSDLARKMTKCYDAAADAKTGMFSEKVEAGVLAVCDQFHLVYYSGVGGDLTMRSKDK